MLCEAQQVPSLAMVGRNTYSTHHYFTYLLSSTFFLLLLIHTLWDIPIVLRPQLETMPCPSCREPRALRGQRMTCTSSSCRKDHELESAGAVRSHLCSISFCSLQLLYPSRFFKNSIAAIETRVLIFISGGLLQEVPNSKGRGEKASKRRS